MNALLKAAFCVLSFSSIWTLAVADSGTCQRTPSIEVTGRASISVPADQQTWSIQAVSRGSIASAVADSHQDLVSTLIGDLDRTGIAKSDLKVGIASLTEETKYVGREQDQEVREIVARTRIIFENRDVSRYSALRVAVSKHQGVEIGYVMNDTSRRIALREEARTNALLAAKQKAEAMASVYGVKVLDPILIQESGPRQLAGLYGNSLNNRAVSQEGASEELPGKVEIVEEVAVVFGIGRVAK